MEGQRTQVLSLNQGVDLTDVWETPMDGSPIPSGKFNQDDKDWKSRIIEGGKALCKPPGKVHEYLDKQTKHGLFVYFLYFSILIH